MKKILLTMTLVGALSGCVSQAAETLDQKLAGKQGAERKETLRLACLNEAEWPLRNSYAYKHGSIRKRQGMRNRYNSEISEMKALCRKMDGLTDAQPEEKLNPQELAGMCAEKVATKTQKQRKGGAEHAQRIQRICTEMTGKPIPVKVRK